jgi:hypothetical protein
MCVTAYIIRGYLNTLVWGLGRCGCLNMLVQGLGACGYLNILVSLRLICCMQVYDVLKPVLLEKDKAEAALRVGRGASIHHQHLKQRFVILAVVLIISISISCPVNRRFDHHSIISAQGRERASIISISSSIL